MEWGNAAYSGLRAGQTSPESKTESSLAEPLSSAPVDWDEATSDPRVRDALVSVTEKKDRILEALAVANDEKVDFVFQGGGMLGVAHVGALYALETMGLRVNNVAGTSAGAIMATLVGAAAAKGGGDQPVSRRVFEDLASMKPSTFLDKSASLRELVTLASSKLGRLQRGLRVARAALPALASLTRSYGLHPGNTFTQWLDSRLARYGINTLADLNGLERISVVTAALPRGLKLVLPRDNILDINPGSERPSFYARASMAIPLVFTPVQVPLHGGRWNEYCDEKCKELVSPELLDQLKVANHALLFDGGLFSNLPVDVSPNSENRQITIALFTTKSPIRAPRLVRTKRRLIGHLGELVQAMRGLRDFEARRARTESGKNKTIWIDTEDADWLNFSDDFEMARQLFACGVEGVANLAPTTTAAAASGPE